MLEILPSTKVAALLDAYPELEEPLIAMAPPFKKLRNPILRKSVAKVASLRQASVVGRIDPTAMIDALRELVGQPPLGETATTSTESVSEAAYLGAAPAWFERSCVAYVHDDRVEDSDTMAIVVILKRLRGFEARQVVELITTFLPAPGIDAARNKGILTWTTREGEDLYKTYLTRDA